METGKQRYCAGGLGNGPASHLSVDSRGKERGLVGGEGKRADGVLMSDTKRLMQSRGLAVEIRVGKERIG